MRGDIIRAERGRGGVGEGAADDLLDSPGVKVNARPETRHIFFSSPCDHLVRVISGRTEGEVR